MATRLGVGGDVEARGDVIVDYLAEPNSVAWLQSFIADYD
jgi:hypothetical protein